MLTHVKDRVLNVYDAKTLSRFVHFWIVSIHSCDLCLGFELIPWTSASAFSPFIGKIRRDMQVDYYILGFDWRAIFRSARKERFVLLRLCFQRRVMDILPMCVMEDDTQPFNNRLSCPSIGYEAKMAAINSSFSRAVVYGRMRTSKILSSRSLLRLAAASILAVSSTKSHGFIK